VLAHVLAFDSHVLAHVLAGRSIADWVYVDVSLQFASRHVLRSLASLDDPRPARNYAQRVVAAGPAQVRTILGITSQAAQGVVAWAQGVLASLADQDSARAQATQALAEIGD